MIVGIGIDATDIKRFKQWHTYSQQKLLRIFSSAEIKYCLQEPIKSAERFAARFAAREALWKALFQAGSRTLFLSLCKQCEVMVTDCGPQLIMQGDFARTLKILLSITHSSEMAVVMVVLQTVR